MKILKFTEQNIEPTNEEVTESKLIDKKFISDNLKGLVELLYKNVMSSE